MKKDVKEWNDYRALDRFSTEPTLTQKSLRLFQALKDVAKKSLKC